MHDHVWQPRWIGSEEFVQRGHVRQLQRLDCDVQLIGQFSLAATLMRQGEEFDYRTAGGLPLRQTLRE